MKPYILLLLSFFLFSCSRQAEHNLELSQVETNIESRPDSALTVLQSINPSELTKADKAKHALLLSMALDKNYIDKTDFETLQPAIDYYKSHGTATDKLRTYYYQGRIYQNQHNEGAAMNCYLKALEEGDGSEDELTRARLYVAQANIYDSLMEFEKSIEANLAAAEIFEKVNRPNSYVNCLINALGGYIQMGDVENCEKCFALCSKYLNQIPMNRLNSYYSGRLTYLTKFDLSELPETIDEYFSAVPEEMIDYLALCSAYTKLGEYEKALDALSKTPEHYAPFHRHEQKYSAVAYTLYKKIGDYEKALGAYEKNASLRDSITFAILEQDTQFIEERHALEMNTVKERETKNMIILWSLIIVIALTASVIYIRSRLKIKTMETEKYKLLCQQIEDERDNLSELLSKNGDLDSDAKAAVSSRLDLLNKFFTAYITENAEINRKVTKELEDLLTDKDNFMSSTKKAFAGSHPKFIKYLEDHNLTESEIQYCCLYALGLKGKEVGAYLKMRGHYNISSEIRAKLGLSEGDTNLGIHIRKLLKSLE